MEEEEKDSGFKVKDRRRFDSSGNLRGEEDKNQEKSEKETQTGRSSQSSPAESASQQPDFVMSESESKSEFSKHSDAPIDFSSFVLSLATQVMIQLGEIPAPGGANIPQDIHAARQTIEVLGLLEEKTKGNLSKSEQAMMEEILHNLRLTYVQKAS